MAAYSSAPGHFVTVSEKDRPSSGERKAMSLSLWMRPNSRRLWNDTTFNRALHQAHPAENLKGAEGGATALGNLPDLFAFAEYNVRIAHLLYECLEGWNAKDPMCKI